MYVSAVAVSSYFNVT